MKRSRILPLLAVIGFSLAIVAVLYANKPVSFSAKRIVQFTSPYTDFIAGTGLVEATTGNIDVGTPVSGVVMEIYVKVGDQVKIGDPLFKIDDRGLQAQLLTARAKVGEAVAALQKPKHRLEHAEQLNKRDSGVISEQDLGDLQDEAGQAAAALVLVKAQLAQLQLEIDRHTVRALVEGQVLQLKMRLGQYLEGSSLSPATLLLGGDERMNLRVDVDEYDAYRIDPGMEAVAFVRGHPDLKVALRYEYIEPYIVPKVSLSGMATERTDTRVLQLAYSFKRASFPVFMGQQLDVLIHSETGNAIKSER